MILIATYLGFQGLEILAVVHTRHPRRGRVRVARVERGSGRQECSSCGRRHGRALFVAPVPVWLLECSIGDVEAYLEVQPARLACRGGARVERLPFAVPGFQVTRRFFERIAALCPRLPVSAVARVASLPWGMVARVDMRVIELGLGDRTAVLAGPRWIAALEVSRRGGREYFTILTGLESGRVVWIGDGQGRRGLPPFLPALGAKGRRKLKGAVSDLGYLAIIAARLPRAVHTLDRFHLLQWVNRALDEPRRRLFPGAPPARPAAPSRSRGGCRYRRTRTPRAATSGYTAS